MSNYKSNVLKKKRQNNQQTHRSNKKQPNKIHDHINSSAFTHRFSWAFSIYINILAPQMFATTAPLSKAMMIVANTSRAKTSIPNESTIWAGTAFGLEFPQKKIYSM